ncbi:amino acid permease-domain-containing protein [Aspergillus pseudoustus]|uniref:Amino acid permease-domain-containing protein n=1 Tax=Aspergillus pseudoustus TaxID=1810923 RepID=A0ABR4J7N3_9EURO
MENPAISSSGPQAQTKKDSPVSRTGSVEIGQVASNSWSAEAPSKSNETNLSAAIREAVNHRRLNPRQIQLTAIAGSIGAALFVAIGSGVMSGPLCLFLAFVFWASIVFCIAQCQIEIVTLLPLDGSFIRLAGRMVDPALGVAVGWNHFFAQTSYVIFEATVINTLVEYWGYNQSPAILISISLVLYLAINVYRADLFGEAEFWLALGKVLLAMGLILFTIVAMLGGNPLHEQVPRFVIAGESRDPRRTVPRAFRTIMARLIVFFIGGCLCVGILVPYDDPTLTNGSDTYAGASP